MCLDPLRLQSQHPREWSELSRLASFSDNQRPKWQYQGYLFSTCLGQKGGHTDPGNSLTCQAKLCSWTHQVSPSDEQALSGVDGLLPHTVSPFVSCGTFSKVEFSIPRKLLLDQQECKEFEYKFIAFPLLKALFFGALPMLPPKYFTNLLCANSVSFPLCLCTHICPLVPSDT